MASNVHQEVTDRILIELEKGAAPWVKPWRSNGGGGASGLPRNAKTGSAYTGTNIILLWLAAESAGYPTHEWLTYNQAVELGGHVRKGEKSTRIIFASRTNKKDENGEKTDKYFAFAKFYLVFNIAQCEGLPERIAKPLAPRHSDERCPEAEEFILATGADITYGANQAMYVPSMDEIYQPAFGSFVSGDTYYATLFHEIGHWTGHASRLDRSLKTQGHKEEYALEELVAELTSAFLCAEFGFDGDLRHAGYIENWIRLLKEDNKAFMKAASAAQKAADLLRGLAITETPDLAIAA